MHQPSAPGGPAGINRRTLLRGAGLAGAGLLGSSLLAACAGDDAAAGSDTQPSTPTSGSGGSAGSSAGSSAGAPSSSSGGGGGGGGKTLNLMLASWVDTEFVESILQKSAADPLGVTLNLMTVDDGTYPAQAAAAQSSGEAPDLIFWTAQGIPSLLAAGVNLMDLTSHAESENKADFYEQNYQASTIGGKLYGLGIRCQCRGIVYRGDYAEAAGLTVPDEWTFDEFGAFAKGLNVDGHIGFAYEAKVGDGRASSNFLPLLWSTGGALVKGEAGAWEIGCEQEQIETVLTFYSDAVNTWKSTPADVANWGYQETDGNFSKGLLASYSAGPFVVPNAAQYPETLKNIKVGPLPNAGKPATFWEEHTLMIHGDAPNADLAWQFLENVRSEKTQTEIAGRFNDAQLSVRPKVTDAIDNEVLKGFAPLMPTAIVPQPINIAPPMNEAVLPAMGEVALGVKSPADAAAGLITNLKSVLEKLNAG